MKTKIKTFFLIFTFALVISMILHIIIDDMSFLEAFKKIGWDVYIGVFIGATIGTFFLTKKRKS